MKGEIKISLSDRDGFVRRHFTDRFVKYDCRRRTFHRSELIWTHFNAKMSRLQSALQKSKAASKKRPYMLPGLQLLIIN